jgi:exonuclease III
LLNIRHGGGLRAQAILDWLTSCSADVVVLPEWRENASGQLIKRGLEATGFHTANCSRVGANGILAASKGAFSSRRVTPAGSEKGELLLADLGSGCKLLTAYFPQGKAKVPFFMECLDEAARSNAEPLFLLGDLNTGRNDADVEGAGTPFDCSELFEALESKGALVDLWRSEHGQQKTWSWRSTKNGFRVDHAFANTAFRKRFPAISCSYDHSTREVGLTDHSALILKCA